MCLSRKDSCNPHLEIIKRQLLGSFFIQQLGFRTNVKPFQKEKVALKKKIISRLSLLAHILCKRDQIDMKGFKALFSSPSPNLIYFGIHQQCYTGNNGEGSFLFSYHSLQIEGAGFSICCQQCISTQEVEGFSCVQRTNQRHLECFGKGYCRPTRFPPPDYCLTHHFPTSDYIQVRSEGIRPLPALMHSLPGGATPMQWCYSIPVQKQKADTITSEYSYQFHW